MSSRSRVPPDAAVTPARRAAVALARREWMVYLSAVLFVLGMAGLGLVVTLYELDQDRLHQAAVAAFSERMPAMPVSNFHHVDNSKYLREAAGCIFVLALAAIVRYRAPRKIRVAERVRVVEKWMQRPPGGNADRLSRLSQSVASRRRASNRSRSFPIVCRPWSGATASPTRRGWPDRTTARRAKAGIAPLRCRPGCPGALSV